MSTDPYEAPTADFAQPSPALTNISRAEVIGWAFTAQAILLYVVCLLTVVGMVEKAGLIFKHLHAVLPSISQVVLQLGDGGVFCISTAITAVPVFVMLKVRNGRVQVVLPILACVLQAILLKLCFVALTFPILYLQNGQLS